MDREKTVKEQIELLKKLQLIDGEIYALRREKAGLPVKIKSIEESLEAKKSGITEAEGRLKSLQLKLKDSEVGLQQKEEQVKKLQIQLYQLKSNKEYSAMLTEIEGLKADNSLVEEEILKLMDEIDGAKRRIIQEKKLFEDEKARAQEQKDVINKRLREIEDRLAGLSLQRNSIIPEVDKQILNRYERVLENRDGLAIVPVDNAACGGCHMNLPPQVISEAKLKEDIVVCGSCNRILYVDDDVEIS